MFFSSYRKCCCGLGGGIGGENECLFCWSLRSTCSTNCPDGGPTGGNGTEDCDPLTDATCETIHENVGENDCVGCTYTYSESESLCYQTSLCPCVWVCFHDGCTTTPPGGPLPSTACPIIKGCPDIIDGRLQCPDQPCPDPNHTPECDACSNASGTWTLVQDPYASTAAGNTEPTCSCCCTGYTGQIVSC